LAGATGYTLVILGVGFVRQYFSDIDQMCEAVQSALLQIKPILEENE